MLSSDPIWNWVKLARKKQQRAVITGDRSTVPSSLRALSLAAFAIYVEVGFVTIDDKVACSHVLPQRFSKRISLLQYSTYSE
jgi:hypothetical protein